MQVHRVLRTVGVLASLAPMLATPKANACGGYPSAPLTSVPSTGATDVSPHTSLMVMGGDGSPAGLTLEANGQPVPLPALQSLGHGFLPRGRAMFWRFQGPLVPSTTYVLRVQEAAGSRELTRFTTAASYDKAPGTAPILERLRLWRVRYDLREIAAGGCVFDEYEGYVDLDYQPGAVPGTPMDEVVHVVALRPKNGSSTETWASLGPATFEDVPADGRPSPTARWKPILAPDREYCATVTLYGRNDRAMPEVRSETLCAPVMNIDARKRPDGGADAGTPDAGTPDAAVTPDAAAAFDSADTQSPAVTMDAASPPASGNTESGGCSTAPAGRFGTTPLIPGLLLGLVVARRRRRS
jgi:uncharacterized protein (TIGR03382 family)